jgi:hypothetical protein
MSQPAPSCAIHPHESEGVCSRCGLEITIYLGDCVVMSLGTSGTPERSRREGIVGQDNRE